MENYLHAFQRVLPHFQWIGVVRFECRRQRIMMNFPGVQLPRIVHAPDLENTRKQAHKYEMELNKEEHHRTADSPNTRTRTHIHPIRVCMLKM